MPGRGVLFALTDDDAASLRAIGDDAGRLEHLHNDIEERFFDGPDTWLAETDKAWLAIHAVLTSPGARGDGGPSPLDHVILGGEPLLGGDDVIMSLKSPARVRDIARTLAAFDEARFQIAYQAVNGVGEATSSQDEGYVWRWLQRVREIYAHASADARWVLFTADR